LALRNVPAFLVLGISIAFFATRPASAANTESELHASSGHVQREARAQVETRRATVELAAAAAPSAFPALEAFASKVVDGQADQLLGMYVPEVLALRVVQQPAETPEFVSPRQNIATQFQSASTLGSTGLLAHNYLAGEKFSLLQEDQELFLIYGDGRTAKFIVSEILEYQALQPDSPYSEFIDLQTNARLSASRLFSKIYSRSGQVILQTCIAVDREESWGRLFVIAEPAVN
jgi:hypothetical protein